MNWKKKAILSSKPACNVQLFPCSQSNACQTFWIYRACTATLPEHPDTQQFFPSNGIETRKQPGQSGHIENPP